MFNHRDKPAAEEWRMQGRRYISNYVAKQTMNKCSTCQCEGWPFCTRRKVLDVKPVDATLAVQNLKVGGELAKLADITT